MGTQESAEEIVESTVKWRLAQIETKTDKMDSDVKVLSTKMTVMEVLMQAILGTQVVIKKTAIALVVSNIVMYFITMWMRLMGWGGK